MIYLNLSRETGEKECKTMKSLSVDMLSSIGGITGLKRFILIWHDYFEYNGNFNVTQMTTLKHSNQYMYSK
jgi:hypothetical protein